MYFKLDDRPLAEDLTDQGAMSHPGVRMMLDARNTRLKQVLWGIEDRNVRRYVGPLTPIAQKLIALLSTDRDAQKAHEQLKHSLVDNCFPATAVKLGGEHEASIIAYIPGTKSKDGKHSSKYGFVVIRDQATFWGEDEELLKKGIVWRDPGMDNQTCVVTVEDFVKAFAGFASAVKKDF